MNYVASVGWEPAPVVLGYFLVQNNNIHKIILIPEDDRIRKSSRTAALKEFLTKKSSLEVVLEDAPQQQSFESLKNELKVNMKAGDFVNITGGSKRFSIAMLMAQENVRPLTINGHSNKITATIIDKANNFFSTFDLDRFLSAQDYLDLYQKDADILQSNYLKKYDAISVRLEKKTLALIVRNNRPFVFDHKVLEAKDKPEKMRRLKDLSFRLAGSFAKPVFQYGRIEGDEEKQQAHIAEIERYARAYRGISCKIGDYKFLDNPPQKTNSLDALPNDLLDNNKPTLIALVSDQLVPCLQSQAQYEAEQIYLLTSKEKAENAQRLKEYFSPKVRVKIVDLFNPDNPQLLANYIEKLVAHHKAELWLNLNGGTSLMAVSAFLAKSDTPAHYIAQNKLQLFNNEESSELLTLDIEIIDFLAVHGYKLTSSKTYPLDEKLYNTALSCIKENQITRGSIRETNSWPIFEESYSKINKADQVVEGDPNEYATYYELCTCLGKDAKVLAESKIEIPEKNPANINKKVKLSPDALVLCGGRLLTVEVKNNIRKIFETNSASNQLFMSQALGGHFARSLIVCGRFGKYRDSVNNNRLEHLLNDDIAKQQLTIAIRKRVDSWPQLETFPPENGDNPRELFKKWGWL